MNKDLTHICIVLDDSASMNDKREGTIEGFNAYVQKQLAAPGNVTIEVLKFSTASQWLPHDTYKIGDDNYTATGASTALLDAVGRAIDTTGKEIANLHEDTRPAKVVMLIITDGLENASHEYSSNKIKQMIDHQTEVYKWEFVYLGANHNAWAVGTSYGMHGGNTYSFPSTNDGILTAFAHSAVNTLNYRSGKTNSMNFTDKQRADEKKNA